MLLATLGASLIGNMLAEKRMLTAGYLHGNGMSRLGYWHGKQMLRGGYVNKINFWCHLSL